MPRFRFAKLVRDNIVDQQIASGAKPNYRLLAPNEHKQELVNKIIEEAQELSAAEPNEIAAEIADVQQAIDDLRALHGLTEKDVVDMQQQKNDKNGAFNKGIYVEDVEVAEGNKWTSYYRKNADRYPEINSKDL